MGFCEFFKWFVRVIWIKVEYIGCVFKIGLNVFIGDGLVGIWYLGMFFEVEWIEVCWFVGLNYCWVV